MSNTPFYGEIQKIGPYLNNFLTDPYTFLAYSGDSDPNLPEYAKMSMGLVRKLLRYERFLNNYHEMKAKMGNLQKWHQNFNNSFLSRDMENRSKLDNFLTNPYTFLVYLS